MKTLQRMRFRPCGGRAAVAPVCGRQQVIVCLGAIILVTAIVVEMPARADTVRASPAPPTNNQTARKIKKNTGISSRAVAPADSAKASDKLVAAPSPSSAADLDKLYGIKGWNIRSPSFGDTLTQDYGGWRAWRT